MHCHNKCFVVLLVNCVLQSLSIYHKSDILIVKVGFHCQSSIEEEQEYWMQVKARDNLSKIFIDSLVIHNLVNCCVPGSVLNLSRNTQ